MMTPAYWATVLSTMRTARVRTACLFLRDKNKQDYKTFKNCDSSFVTRDYTKVNAFLLWVHVGAAF